MRAGLETLVENMGRVHYRQRRWRSWARVAWWLLLLPLALACWAALQQTRPRQVVAWGLAGLAALTWTVGATGSRQQAPRTPAADVQSVPAAPRPSPSPSATASPTPSTTPSPSPSTAPPPPAAPQPVAPYVPPPAAPPVVVAPPPVVAPLPRVTRTTAPATTPPPPVRRTPAPTRTTTAPAPPPVAASSYANCTEARAAGVTPLHRGEAGYSAKLDRDGDGVACE